MEYSMLAVCKKNSHLNIDVILFPWFELSSWVELVPLPVEMQRLTPKVQRPSRRSFRMQRTQSNGCLTQGEHQFTTHTLTRCVCVCVCVCVCKRERERERERGRCLTYSLLPSEILSSEAELWKGMQQGERGRGNEWCERSEGKKELE